MTAAEVKEWLVALAFVVTILAIPWIFGYIALALGVTA